MKDKEEQIKQEFPNEYNAYYKNKNLFLMEKGNTINKIKIFK